jgi:predicted neuraminidase
MVITSADEGATWSKPRRLPEGILGPIKDKPIRLDNGTILSPSSTENDGWQVHMERSNDGGATWTRTGPLNDGKTLRLIQPTLLDYGGGKIQALCRSRSQWVYELWSADSGRTWERPEPTTLPNPNSGIDAVRLADGRSLVVYNHSATKRFPLNVAVSKDGKSWGEPIVIEDLPDGEGQLSYPAAIQTADGLVHLTYTWSRVKIRHVVVDPKRIP